MGEQARRQGRETPTTRPWDLAYTGVQAQRPQKRGPSDPEGSLGLVTVIGVPLNIGGIPALPQVGHWALTSDDKGRGAGSTGACFTSRGSVRTTAGGKQCTRHHATIKGTCPPTNPTLRTRAPRNGALRGGGLRTQNTQGSSQPRPTCSPLLRQDPKDKTGLGRCTCRSHSWFPLGTRH